MKLRIKGNSVRLRLTRSELEDFVSAALISESVHFGPAPNARLTYALQHRPAIHDLLVEYEPGRFTIVMPTAMALKWSETDQVGIAAEIDIGPHGPLSVLIEKDFACLDRGDAANADSFPNPLAGYKC